MSLPADTTSNRLKQIWRIARSAMQNKRIRQLLYLGLIIISLAFIGYVLVTNWAQLKNLQWHIDPIYVILPVILYPVGMIPAAAAWHWLLKAFSIDLPYIKNLRLYAISSLPKHIPGFVWYVTSRTLMYEEIGVSASTVLGATAAETIMLALSGFVTAVLIFAFGADIPANLGILRYLAPIAVIALILVFAWAPGGTRVLDKLVKRLNKEAQPIQFRRSGLAGSLTWMFIAWTGGGILLWVLTRGITPIGIAYMPIMVGAWGAAGAVGLTIGIGIQGLGLREVTLAAILSTVISPVTAIVVAIAFRLALTIGEFLWVFLISVFTREKPLLGKSQS